MSDDKSKNNKLALQYAEEVQADTKDTLHDIQRQTAQTEEIAQESLLELIKQKAQLEHTQAQAKRTNAKLDETNRNLNRLDRWAGRWGGRNKRDAKKEAEMERSLDRANLQKKVAANARINSVTASSSTASTEATTPTKKKKKKTLAKGRSVKAQRTKLVEEKDLKNLDEEEKDRMRQLEKNDQEIDDMLDETGEALQRLNVLSQTISQETRNQNVAIGDISQDMDSAADKQAFVNHRVRGMLHGKFAKRAEAAD